MEVRHVSHHDLLQLVVSGQLKQSFVFNIPVVDHVVFIPGFCAGTAEISGVEN